jgi:hypothetical protein
MNGSSLGMGDVPGGVLGLLPRASCVAGLLEHNVFQACAASDPCQQ